MTKLTLVLLLFLARHGLALKRTESQQHRHVAHSEVTLQDLLGISEAPEQAAPQMQVRPATAKLEIGRSDPWVAAHMPASKASGLKILGAR
jgi:hypothetical protein